MYNRYIRNDAGVYQRVTVPDGPPPGQGPPPPPPPEQGPLLTLTSLFDSAYEA